MTGSQYFRQYEDEEPRFVLSQLFIHRLYFYKLPPSSRSIIWIPFQSNTQRSQLPNLISLLLGWLHRGPIIEYESGILCITHFPHPLPPQLLTQIYQFFHELDLEIHVYTGTDIVEDSTIGYYNLPSADTYNKTEHSWNFFTQSAFPNLVDFSRNYHLVRLLKQQFKSLNQNTY